jgi:hypothetical protein
MLRSDLDQSRQRRLELHRSARVARARATEACIAAQELRAEARRLRERPKRAVRERSG